MVTASYRCWSLGASTSFVYIFIPTQAFATSPSTKSSSGKLSRVLPGRRFLLLQCDSHCKSLTRWWSPLTNTELIQSKASSNFPGASYQLRSIPSQWVRPALNRCPLCWGTSWFLWLPRSNRGRWDLLLEGTFSIFQTKRAWSGSC